MNFLNSVTGLGKETPSDDKSSPDLMTSAKQVAESAQLAANKQYENVAGAGADLLEGAKGYAKVGTDGVGKVVGQAHDYLAGATKEDPKP